jgi:FMN phosphatase YigB (HAD superfamily)
MTLTLLVDLDDTLLSTNIEAFQPAYIKSLSTYFTKYVQPEKMVPILLSAIKAMTENDDPAVTIKEKFDKSFYPKLGLDENEIRDYVDRYYAEVFPSLQSITTIRPAAKKFIDAALNRGYKIAIATNPFFPRQATYHRLRWACLPPEEYPFEIISTYEDFHYTKPNPAYFTELLAQIGWPDQPVIVIGNDVEADIKPANRLDIPTFWVNEDPNAKLVGETEAPIWCGSLDDIMPALQAAEATLSTPTYTSQVGMLAVLKSTPAAIDTFMKQTDSRSLSARPEKDEWSFSEILCHLRDVEKEVNHTRLEKILTEDNAFIPGIDTDTWAVERDYFHQDGATALRDFMKARCETIAILDKIQSTDWERKTRHAIFGPTTLAELVCIIAAHDRNHICQIFNTLKTLK